MMDVEQLRVRWQKLSRRERLGAQAIALMLPALIWSFAVHDPLNAKIKAAEGRQRVAESHEASLRKQLDELVERQNQQAEARQKPVDELRRQRELVSASAAQFVDPQQMRTILRELLAQEPGITLREIRSSTQRLPPPAAEPAIESGAPPKKGAAAEPERSTTPSQASLAPRFSLYRQSVTLELEGGYFEVRNYLRNIEQAGLGVLWGDLHYSTQPSGQGRVVLEVFTITQEGELPDV